MRRFSRFIAMDAGSVGAGFGSGFGFNWRRRCFRRLLLRRRLIAGFLCCVSGFGTVALRRVSGVVSLRAVGRRFCAVAAILAVAAIAPPAAPSASAAAP